MCDIGSQIELVDVSFPSAMASRIARISKQVVGYSEDTVPVASSKDWVQDHLKEPKQWITDYIADLFPILNWITRYNWAWLYGDVVAGLTVGMVLVPQSMSYAQIATLPPQSGLYSSFVGVLIYCFFGTSKDVSIGPVAVMSLTMSQIISAVDKQYPELWSGPQIATTLAFLCGFIVLGIGLLRLGWIVDFIPLPAVSGFITGSALNIIAGQVPGLMGITGFNTRAATYLVIINTLKGLPNTQKDAAFGLFGLFALYLIRSVCSFISRRYPRRARLMFFVSCLRNAFVIIILTLAAWLYTRHRKSKSGKYPVKILGTVPSKFRDIGPPHIDPKLVKALVSQLPVATIILLLEHIAIGKSFGRINGYKINPNQELIAIGVTNTIGSCFHAYPATGSFSRTAINSQAGVRTPAAGVLTAIVVVVALYGLTPAFYWIPTAGLSAVIIHAVGTLIASPAQVYSYWRVSPLEFFIWVAAVLVTVFSTIEDGIYTSILVSLALLLVRIAFPRGKFLGKVILHLESRDPKVGPSREVFVPLTRDGSINSPLKVTPPSPGVIVYRLEESYLYPSSPVFEGALVDYVKTNTRRAQDLTLIKASDRPWNDPGPSLFGVVVDQAENEKRPILHAIVLDFSTVPQIDATAIQALIDTRTVVEKWAGHPVEFHFASVLSPWIRRALVAAGFGTGIPASQAPIEVAPISPHQPSADQLHVPPLKDDLESPDIKHGHGSSSVGALEESPLVSTDTPFFHFDLAAAVRAAESGLPKSHFPTSPEV